MRQAAAQVTGSEIREALEQAGVRPNRQLGQNFLTDPDVARWIVDQLELQPGDTVVEVGPGTGALSRQLIGRVRRLVLIEFDARLAAWLERAFAAHTEVEVIHADAARFDPRVLWKWRPVKFLGNLPYSAGGAIVRNFLSKPQPFTRAVIMLQKEVIDRFGAEPRTKAYGVLTLRIRSQWRVTPLRTIPPQAFYPRPAIDSTVAVLEPLDGVGPAYDLRRFDELIRRGFAQRRKQLRKQLPPEPPWDEIAARLGVEPAARAEELSLDEWIALTRAYDPHPLAEVPQRADEAFDVVDAEDQVIGRASRDRVHAEGLMHRAVHLFVVNGRGELLLQKRSWLKDAHPGVWDSSVAGHLDAGEDYPSAARREMREEMGIEGVEPEEIGRLAPSAATGWEHIRLYLVRWQGRPQFPCAEVESVLWLAADELDAWIAARPADFASGFLECWALARGRGPASGEAHP